MNANRLSHSKMQGRTLVEILSVLAIVAILSQGALSYWQEVLANHQARASTGALMNAIRMARSSSVELRRIVTMCPVSSENSCGDDWSSGILVFLDENADGKINAKDRVLQQLQPAVRGSSIDWRSFRRKKWLQFTPSGHTAQQNGSFIYCPDNQDRRIARVVIVNKLGHSRLGKDRNGDGIVEMASGKPVQCG